ncbi:MAG: efflux RND transporter permease subunit [Eubacterium sp.]|nr:efflux RND transporter permease subunit [Eubacterium sp.]
MLSKFSVKRPYTVLVGVVLVIVLGVVALRNMTADLLPNMTFPYAVVITTDMGASPEAVESDVTAPIEAALATTSNLKQIQSRSYFSYSMVILEYEQSANMDSVLIEIQQSLDQVKSTFGDSVGSPIVMQINPDMIPIYIAAVGVEGMDITTLTTYVDSNIKPQLESIEGVASVTAMGGVTEQIRVTLDDEKIKDLNQKVQEAINAQFDAAEKQLDDAEKMMGGRTLEDKKAFLETNKQSLAALSEQLSQASSGAAELQNAIAGLTQVIALYDDGTLNDEQFTAANGMDIAAARAQLEELNGKLDEIEKSLAEQNESFAQLGITITSLDDLPTAIGAIAQMTAGFDMGIAAVDAAIARVDAGELTEAEALAEIRNNEALSAIIPDVETFKLDTGLTIDETRAQLDDAKAKAAESADIESILDMDLLEKLLTAQNFEMPAGYVNDARGQFLVKVGDKVESMDALADLVLIDLGLEGIDPIKVSDVADVEMVDDSAEVYANVDGRPGIILSFEKQTGYSTGDVTDAINEKFKSLEKSEDEDIKFSTLMDQGLYIDIITSSIFQNMIIGAALAIIILIIFLKDGRPTLIIACAIPLSVIFAIVLMYFSNVTLNIISMSGLTLGIGMLVDNSIVVIENIYRLRNEGMSIKKAAVYGASQVAGAITASTLTTVCVFAPIVFTDGITRQLFVDMGLTILYTLGASLLVALTLVPAMAGGMLGKEKKKKEKKSVFDKAMDWYSGFLRKCLRFKPLVFIVMIVILVLSVFLAVSRGTAFMPEMSSTQATVTLEPFEGENPSLEEMTAYSDTLVEKLMEFPEVTTVGAMSGGGSGLSMFSGAGGNDVKITVYVIVDEEAKVSNDELEEKINKAAEGLHCQVKVSANMMDSMSALSGTGISINIKGRDMEKMQAIASDVAAILEDVEGTVDIDDGLNTLSDEMHITVDKDKAAKYGMTVAQVFQIIYGKMAATTASTVIETDVKDYDVFVRTMEQSELTLDELKELTFTYTDRTTGQVSEIPLTEIAEFRETAELSVIQRQAQNRFITVKAGIDEKHNVGLVGNEVRDRLDDYEVPEGYSVEMAGEDETINDAMRQLALMLLLAIIFIYLVMVAQFQSLLSPFIIMFTIPLAFTGGFLALYLTGQEVSVISMVGFVMLSGIIVNNGIVLVDYVNQLRRQGMSKKEAIVEAARTRMRPVLMTALTTIISMSTMAIGLGQGSEMGQPMAIVVVGGLIYGTILTLVVVPCIYDAFNREKDMREEEL